MIEETAEAVIDRLGLAPHPEGGHFRETYRDVPETGGRGAITLIYYLLKAGEISRWHRIDATEIWHFYAGAPMSLSIAGPDRITITHHLSLENRADHTPHVVVRPFAWQSARSTGAWSLVGCTVTPAFQFEGFELAPPGWIP
jgi:predicted cupin superfamily sugar epimerase